MDFRRLNAKASVFHFAQIITSRLVLIVVSLISQTSNLIRGHETFSDITSSCAFRQMSLLSCLEYRNANDESALLHEFYTDRNNKKLL
jgi:hypothetical protein